MAPRRKKNEEEQQNATLDKEVEAIAKYVRFNTPCDTSRFEGNDVSYFQGSKAVDTLLNSKYGLKAKGEPRFPDRKACVSFMVELYVNRLFFRVRKLVKKDKKDEKDKKKGNESDAKQSPRPEANKKKGKKGSDDGNESVNDTAAEEDDKKKDSDDKKKKKVKLAVHEVQSFHDANDVYVWVYDPTPWHKKVIGLMMVLGTIVGCLFPLWPIWLRQGVYYVSLTGIGAFGAIVIIAIVRTVLFGIIWLASMGKHHLWVLPNLTEDCGFFESFKPFYTYEYRPVGKAPKKDKKKKDKDSDAEQEDEKAGSDDEAEAEARKVEEEREEDEEAGDGENQNEEDLDDEEEDEDQSSSGTSVEEVQAAGGDVQTVPKVRRRARKDDDFVVVDK
ncbi:unnamed protein product, partial [Mesorhabditis spiculigera]